MIKYYTEGVCATEIDFKIENGILVDVKFKGGCDGNLKAVSTLIKGMKVEDVIRKLKGVTCESNPTSCVDQLTKALELEVG
jgi:uncharacterized protein (TIGR03905 family)